MKMLATFAAAGALLSIAAPAAAQYYPAPPPQPYPQPGYGNPAYPQPGYGNPAYPQPGYPAPGYGTGNPVTDGVIGQLTGNRYAVNDRQAIAQCANAAAAQFGNGYRNNAYAYNQYGQRWAYNPSYQANARVTAITSVDRRNWGVKVNGLMSSGLPYGGYNQNNPIADLSFRCDVNYNGAVTNLRVNRIQPRRTLGY
ncbi:MULTISPECIES: hypothetical protein [Sphingomonas]|uniref:hypothetical protein n=1 Tax=Sphingomonas TaxID=13687 RepID=UPI000DEFDE8E|nr:MULTISPECIES: hypothetical protein [Sphingomonas]